MVSNRDPVAGALVAVARGYVDHGGRVPVEVARELEGVPAPAWLLAVALVRSDHADLVADTLELATAAGVPRRSLGACVAYVELAGALFAGMSVVDAVLTVSDSRPGFDLATVGDAGRATPRLCGEGVVDALTAGVWALLQPGAMDEVMPTVVAAATPGVDAAVAGLLGLRDGCGALPALWHSSSGRADECFALTPELVRSRGHRVVHRAAPARPRRSAGAPVRAAGPPASGVGTGGDDAASTAARAITEEIEAIEERVPEQADQGVAATTATAGGHRSERPAPWRQLEGAARR